MKKLLKYRSAFDIIGPIMVGPSSSHTAGAVRIGKIVRQLFPYPLATVSITFYGSFAETYKGHGTAVAIVAGLLDYETYDERIPEALNYAAEQNIDVEFMISKEETPFANTAQIELTTDHQQLTVTGVSIGGGAIQITHVEQFAFATEANPALLIRGTQSAAPAIQAKLAAALADPVITVLKEFPTSILLSAQTTQDITLQLIEDLQAIPGIQTVIATSGSGN